MYFLKPRFYDSLEQYYDIFKWINYDFIKNNDFNFNKNFYYSQV